MPKRMRRCKLSNIGISHRLAHRTLNRLILHVMPTGFAIFHARVNRKLA